MKILFLLGEFPALSETFILNQITGLMELGHDVWIYANRSRGDNVVHNDVSKFQLLERTIYSNTPNSPWARFKEIRPLLSSYGTKYAKTFLKSLNYYTYGKEGISLRLAHNARPLLKKGDFDIIHSHFGPNGNLGLKLKKLGVLRGRLATTFHGYDMNLSIDKPVREYYNSLFKEGDLFLPISENWKNRLVELGCDPNKIQIHKMGIDCERFTFQPRRLENGEPIKIVSLARLVEKKGIAYAIRALAELKDQLPAFEYTVIGGGPLESELKRVAKELSIADRIEFLGWMPQEKITDIFSESHILLAPSVTAANGDQEGIPVVLMEAMACGLPIVSTIHSGIPELVQQGVSGLLAPERDVAGLSKQLRYLMKHPENWSEIGQNGRMTVEKKHDIRMLNKDLVALFEAL